MKTMFNITLSLPEPESTDTVDHCDRIVFIVRSIFVHLRPLPDEPENLPNHAINVLSNMPTECLKHLMWTMPPSVCKKIAQDYECRLSSHRYRIQFEVSKSYFIPYVVFINQNLLAIQNKQVKNGVHNLFMWPFFFLYINHPFILVDYSIKFQVSGHVIKCTYMNTGGNPLSECMKQATFPRAFMLHQVWTQQDLKILQPRSCSCWSAFL